MKMANKKRYNCLELNFWNNRKLIESVLSWVCPDCGDELKAAYTQNRVLYCENCKKVWKIYMQEAKIDYDKVKEDGWIGE